MARGKNQAPPSSGRRPKRPDVSPSFAVSAAMRKSHASARDGRAVDHGDDRLVDPVQRRVHALHADAHLLRKAHLPVVIVGTIFFRAAHIAAGAEPTTGARNDQTTQRIVVHIACKGVDELVAHAARVGIHLVRPVQRDLGDVLFRRLEQDVAVVGHGVPPVCQY